MLFIIPQFEQHFEEKILKKGLRLFMRSGMELIETLNSSELRFGGSGTELLLKKKGDKLLSYNCSCAGHFYCHHLAAALFLLQKETLALTPRKKIKSSAKNKSIPPFKKISVGEVLHFIQNRNAKNPDNSRLQSLILSVSEESCFEDYRQLFKIVLSPNYQKGILNQQEIDLALNQMQLLGDKLNRIHGSFRSRYYLQMALLTELQDFLQLRFTGNEEPLEHLKTTACEILHSFFLKKLSVAEKAAWQKALLLSLRNNAVLRSGVFTFLLPRFLSWSRSKSAFDGIKDLLGKRKNTIPYYTRFSALEVALFQVKLREHQVFKSPLAKTDADSVMNERMAKTEMAFCTGKTTYAFKLLDAGYQSVLSTHKLFFDEYTAYCIQKAITHRQSDTECRYLEERLIKGLFLKESELDRWMELLPPAEKQQKINELIAALRQPRFYSFEKLALILKKTQGWDDLIQEIKRQSNAYRLLHEVVLQKFPEYDKNLLLLYAKHLIGAMAALSVYQHQLLLFETARNYIDKLPEADKNLILDKIITHSGSESQLSRHLRRLYGL
ncbi:MAG: hypothetical protein IT236_17985 [Bacteroidia bacterium]|nr:hypothetical protein [Bacteroidia bacterium]